MISQTSISSKRAISKLVAVLIGVVVVVAVGAGYYISTWAPPVTSTPTTPTTPTTTTSPTPTTPTPTPTTTPTTPTTTTSPTTTTPGEGLQYIRGLGDLVGLFRYAKWNMSDYNISEHKLEVYTFTFWDRGDAVYSGFDCRVLEIVVVDPDNTTTNVVVYVSKADWITVVRLIVNGAEMPPYIGPGYVSLMLLAFQRLIIPLTAIYPSPPPEVGYLSYLGSEDINYGNVTLRVDKWRFTPNPQNPDYANIIKVDAWLVRYGEVYLCFYLYVEETTSIFTYAMQEVEFR